MSGIRPYFNSDGRQVWVTDHYGNHVGNFTPEKAVIFEAGGKPNDRKALLTLVAPNAKGWEEFKRALAHHHSLHLPEEHAPDWLFG